MFFFFTYFNYFFKFLFCLQFFVYKGLDLFLFIGTFINYVLPYFCWDLIIMEAKK